MSLSLYQVSVPVFVRGLQNLAGLLEKGQADAVARNYSADVLIAARLAPDMYPLSRQVQIASDMVKNAAARLTGADAPAFPDTETTFDELRQRIAKTIDFVQNIPASQFDGSETRTIVLKFPSREMQFSGMEYLTGFVLPNFYFHLTTAFNILRHNGVKIGKSDFMGL
jgi:hypothetical protein